MLKTDGSARLCCRVMFFSAKPVDEAVFDKLRREAGEKGDIVVLPGIFEHYDNITHQTLEILRAASMDPVATHILKVRLDAHLLAGMCLELSGSKGDCMILCASGISST